MTNDLIPNQQTATHAAARHIAGQYPGALQNKA
jgi:hypothetical protein